MAAKLLKVRKQVQTVLNVGQEKTFNLTYISNELGWHSELVPTRPFIVTVHFKG